MEIPDLHAWNLSLSEAYTLQLELAHQIDINRPLGKIKTVAGIDVSHQLYSNDIFAAVVVIDVQTFAIIEKQSAFYQTLFPYKPGFLSFREAPAMIEALRKLQTPIDALMVDGQGIAHPRRMGIASHLGLWLQNVPTLGCAKSLLFGSYENLGKLAGNSSPILTKDKQTIGYALRTKTNVNPMFISPGHRITFADANRLCFMMCQGYKMPEPTRQAHIFANLVRRQDQTSIR